MPHRRSVVAWLALAAFASLHLPACSAGAGASDVGRKHPTVDALDQGLDSRRTTDTNHILATPSGLRPTANGAETHTITFMNIGTPVLVTEFVCGRWNDWDGNGSVDSGEIDSLDPRADHSKITWQTCPTYSGGTLLPHGGTCDVTLHLSAIPMQNAIAVMNGPNQLVAVKIIRL